MASSILNNTTPDSLTYGVESLRNHNEPFSANDDLEMVSNILADVESGIFTGQVMKDAPIQPKAGDVIVYQKNNSLDRGFMDDQYHRFISRGRNIISHKNLLKKFYQLSVLPCTEESSNLKMPRQFVNFKKQIYTLLKPVNELNSAVLIHYIGDEKLATPQNHGNSRCGRTFVRTTCSTKDKIKNAVKDKRLGPKIIYENLVKENSATNQPLDKTNEMLVNEREAIFTPRDEKQVRNFKEKLTRDQKLHKCEIFSVYEMAKHDLGRFVLKMDLIPNDIIIVGEPNVMSFASTVILAAEKDPSLPQLVSYDTTFQLADSYVSVLVCRNIFLHENPIFPIAFMIHDKKVQENHETFWTTMEKYIKLDPLCSNVPFCSDREQGIVNAVRKILPGTNYVFCSNHIKSDVKEWLRRSSGRTPMDEKILLGQTASLLDSTTEEEFEQLYEGYKCKWSEPFMQYMDKNIKDDLKTACSFNTKRFSVFNDVMATQNQSESYNFVMKHSQGWAELTIDCLILKLFELQCSILLEFSRASRSLGKYHLKKDYSKVKMFVPAYVTMSSSDVLVEFKSNVKKEDFDITSVYMKSRELSAEECVRRNLVTLVPNLRLFLVQSPYTGKIYNVEVNKNSKKLEDKYKCNCYSPGMCYHKLSVFLSVGENVAINEPKLELNTLKKNARGYKQKSGRKKPNPSELLNTVKEAPDSILAGMKRKRLNETDDDLVNDFLEKFEPDNSGEDCNLQSTDSIAALDNKIDEFETGLAYFRSLDHAIDRQTPPLIPGEESLLSGLGASLKGTSWLDGDVIDTTIETLIANAKVCDVVYISSYLFAASSASREFLSESLIQFSIRNDALNKDVVFVTINESSHWMLGCIVFATKTIYLVDSFQHLKPNRQQIFETLFLIAATVSMSGLLSVRLDEWTFALAQDSPIQKNFTECGVITCIVAFCLLNSFPFPSDTELSNKKIPRNRRWILKKLSDAKDLEKKLENNSRKRLSPTQKKCMLERLNGIKQSINGKIVYQLKNCYSEIRYALVPSNCNWTLCDETLCSGDKSHNEQQFLCVSCRKWFHRSHADIDSVKDCDYYFCKACKENRLAI